MLRTVASCLVLLAVFTARAEALTMGVFTGHIPCANIFDPSCDVSNPQYLSGSFFLDEATAFDPLFVTSLGSTGFLTSPLQTIEGQFGEYTFEGSASPVQFGMTFESSVVLHVADYLEVLDLQEDFWILRTALTGPAVNGVSPTLLNLFIYTAPPNDSHNNISIFPPITSGYNPSRFQYAIGFSDGSLAFGALSTVQVPDSGPTWLLLSMAGIAVVVRRKTAQRAVK